MKIKLTEKNLQGLTCPSQCKDKVYTDAEDDGFRVRVTAAGAKIFQFQWRDKATLKKHTLRIGAWPNMPASEARQRARKARVQVDDGANPYALVKARRAAELERQREDALTVGRLIDLWDKRHLVYKRETYRKDALKRLKRYLVGVSGMPAGGLTRKHVVTLLHAIQDDTKRVHARSTDRTATMAHVATYGSAMYGWALRADLVKENPFKNLPISKATRERDRVLSANELGAVYNAAMALPYPFGPFLRLLTLTGQRLNEVAGMRWSELTVEGVWEMPAERQKNAKPHRVHLNGPAQACIAELRALPRMWPDSDFVFTTTGGSPISGFGWFKRDLDARSGITGWTFHDLRRTMVTRMAESGVPHEVADKVLGHKAGAIRGVARRYQLSEYLPERKTALDGWGSYVEQAGANAALTRNDTPMSTGRGRAAYMKERRSLPKPLPRGRPLPLRDVKPSFAASLPKSR